MNILKVGMVQQSCGRDIPANIEKLKSNIRKCAELGAQLVVLQELHNSVYFCQHEEAALCDLAEPIPGPSTEIYGELAKELGTTLKPRFSAGYGDLPLATQKDIFSALGLDKNLGVLLGDGLLMTPTKSVTAFVGLCE